MPDVAAIVAESRARQGLPAVVEDPGVIGTVAAILGRRQAPGRSNGAPKGAATDITTNAVPSRTATTEVGDGGLANLRLARRPCQRRDPDRGLGPIVGSAGQPELGPPRRAAPRPGRCQRHPVDRPGPAVARDRGPRGGGRPVKRQPHLRLPAGPAPPTLLDAIRTAFINDAEAELRRLVVDGWDV